VLLCAHALDGDRARTIDGLAGLYDGGDIWTGVHERVAHHAGQVLALLDLGDREGARSELGLMLATSFSVHHRKDDQYERWSGWAAQLAGVAPAARVAAAVRPLVRGMVVMHGDGRGYDPDSAASTLIAGAAALDPGWARDLLRWLLANKGSTRHAALSGFLKGLLLREPSSQTVANALLATARLVVPSRWRSMKGWRSHWAGRSIKRDGARKRPLTARSC